MNKKQRNTYLKGLILCTIAIRPDLIKDKKTLHSYVKKIAQNDTNFRNEKNLKRHIHGNVLDLTKRSLLSLQ